MPTINKQPKKPKPERKDTDMRALRQKAYQNTAWRKMRDTYLKEHPLCEDCLAKGKVTPASSIHHIRSPFSKGVVNWNLLLSYDNLMSLCHECHGLRHAEEQGYKSPEKIIEELDALLGNIDSKNEK